MSRSAIVPGQWQRLHRIPVNGTSALPAALGMQARALNINIFDAAKDHIKLTNLKKALDDHPDEKKALEYLRGLNASQPGQVMESIERGWLAKKFPVNEPFLKEYLKAVSKLGKIDGLNISGLLKLVSAAPTAQGQGIDNVLSQIIHPAQSAFSDRGTHSQPLYVTKVEPTFKEQVGKMLGTALMWFIAFTFISAYLDDKVGGAGGLASKFGVGSAVHQAEKSDKTFADVVGIDEAKAELEEIVMYLRDPKRFTRLGGKLPKGVLLTGPPGTGKTLLARAIAGEAHVPFFQASGSEFEEMYVGVGAKRVRELFQEARAKAPCIIFIDEVDAIGGSRQLKDQSAMKMTLNQLLVEMDGFAQNNGIIVIAATNFPDSLDSALIRPGRFDKHVDVTIPDIGGRRKILELYGKKVPMEADVDLDQLARGTPGFSGAELNNLVNQAALKASVDGLSAVSMATLEYAKDRLMMGAERKSAVISPETMKCTAFHEAGHALVAIKTPGADPVHKATIMPRGRALGMVMQLPDGDQTSMSRQQMLARLDVCMGGRLAEELAFGKDAVTSGASNDIMQASRLARAMVTKYGLSDKIGAVFFDDKASYSGTSQNDIDAEVKEILTASYERARVLLTKHRSELDLIAKALMEHESLSGADIVEIMEGKGIEAAKRSQRPSRIMQAVTVIKQRASPQALTTSPAEQAPVPPVGPVAPVSSAVIPAVPKIIAEKRTVPAAPASGPSAAVSQSSASASGAAAAVSGEGVVKARGPPKA